MKLVKIKNFKKAKRVGRGLGSGKGKTAGRGTKGQKSRSGYNLPRRFEGGQTSLIQRLPKLKGFKSRSSKPFVIDIVAVEKKFSDGETVNIKTLLEKKLIKAKNTKVKILGKKLTKKLKFQQVSLNKKLAHDYLGLGKEASQKKTNTQVSKKTAKSTKK